MTPKALEAGLVYYLRSIEEPGAPNSRNTNFDTLRITEKTFEEFEKALQMLLESFHDAFEDSE